MTAKVSPAAQSGRARHTTVHPRTTSSRPAVLLPAARQQSVGSPGLCLRSGRACGGAAIARRHHYRRRQELVVVQATGGPGGSRRPGAGSSWGDRQQRKDDQQIVLGIGIALTLLVLLALRLGGDAFQDADAWDLGASNASFGAGDLVGGLLWAVSLWFCTPLQLLQLFFGFFENERPSDWVLQRMGRAAGLDVDAVDYRVPAPLQAVALALFGASGLGAALTFQALLGDATWSVSSGLGACMAAAMYEVGRPRRLSVEEAQEKERQWQEFRKFADEQLERRGRCHESEIVRKLQRELPKYRGEASGLDTSILRDLIKNWAPDAERSANGFYKGVSLKTSSPTPAPRSSTLSPTGNSGNVTDSTDQY